MLLNDKENKSIFTDANTLLHSSDKPYDKSSFNKKPNLNFGIKK